MDQSAIKLDLVYYVLKGLLETHKVKLHPVKLTIDFEPLNMTVDEFCKVSGGTMFQPLEENHGLTAEQVKTHLTEQFPSGLTWDCVPFTGIRKLNARRSCTSDLQKYGYGKDDFTYEIDTEEDLTIQSYLEAIYRLKTQKYDTWHELLLDAGFKFEDDAVAMTVDFDYGS